MKNLKVGKMRKLRRTLPIVLALTLVHAISTVNGFKDGAPESLCGSMIPSHGSSPQTGPNPYKVVVSKTSVKGQEVVDITITSVSGNDDFKGYLLQVRKPGEDRKAFGRFNEIIENDLGKALKCFDAEHSAVTHNSNKPKKSVTFQWTAPNEEDAEYEILFSVVKSYNEFWTHQPHEEKIRVTRDATATTTSAPVIAASDDLLRRWREAYKGCGDTKGCFGMPGKCIDNFDESSNSPSICKIMVTWEKKGSVNEFQLTGNLGSAQNGYVAVGFSDDAKMGRDSVVGCGYRATSSEKVTLQRYHNPSGTNPNEKFSDPNFKLTATEKTYSEGNLFCKFTQENHAIGDLDIDFDKPHYLLLSTANSIGDDYLGRHGIDDKAPGPQAIVITDNIIMGADANNWLVQLHGGLMVIAWLLCASTGMFVARYYKQTHVEVMPCAKAFWFSLHVFCMASTAFLTICGAIVIIIKKKGLYLTATHPILGIIVVGLAILQVFIAFLRPHPNTPMRPYFNWIHWGIGNSAHIVGSMLLNTKTVTDLIHERL
ncbi:unnamed protein product [Orchesella dallaii]|uniref:Ferric-chelate reductase 1 n=1 Tax=Orchesella dallaii TaxID=48710 RepID=A0ABP1RR49_9HEXA